MKRTWLTVVVPAVAFTLLLVSAGTRPACFGQPVLASAAQDPSGGESDGGPTGVCHAFDSGHQVSPVPFDRTTDYGPVLTFSFALERSILAPFGLGLASRVFTARLISDLKPLIRRKPP